ncbi:MAG: hypothetical protein K6U03_00090 [Firmicutes bacterium]|nr:hypothetical protein [Bacillota bacterium]
MTIDARSASLCRRDRGDSVADVPHPVPAQHRHVPQDLPHEQTRGVLSGHHGFAAVRACDRAGGYLLRPAAEEAGEEIDRGHGEKAYAQNGQGDRAHAEWQFGRPLLLLRQRPILLQRNIIN